MAARRALVLILRTLLATTPLVWCSILLCRLVPEARSDASYQSSLRSMRTHVVDRSEWLSYKIAEGVRALKVVTNAAIPLAQPLQVGVPMIYTMEYQLLTAENTLLRSGLYTFSSEPLLRIDSTTGALYSMQFFDDVQHRPLSSQTAYLTFYADAARARTARIRLHSADSLIEDVGVRVYASNPIPESRIDGFWKRVSPAKRARFARANVYPLAFLTEEEKRNLLTNRSIPQTPTNRRGERPRARRLYSVEGNLQESGLSPTTGPTLTIHPGITGVIRLKAGSSCVKLLLTAQNRRETTEGLLHLSWCSPDGADRSDSLIPLTGLVTTITRDFGEGFLELYSSEPLSVHAFTEGAAVEEEVTPDMVLFPVFLIDERQRLEFPLSHSRAGASLLKLEVRSLFLEERRPTNITYEFLGASGVALRSGSIVANAPKSDYDQVFQGYTAHAVSQGEHVYFSVPGEASTLRLRSSSKGALLALYMLPYDAQVSTGATLADRQVRRSRQTWLLLRPNNYADYLRMQAELSLQLQLSPPTPDARMSSKLTSVESLAPEQASFSSPMVIPAAARSVDFALDPQWSRLFRVQPDSPFEAFIDRTRTGSGQRPRLLHILPAEATWSLEVVKESEAAPRQTLQAEPTCPVGWLALPVELFENGERGAKPEAASTTLSADAEGIQSPRRPALPMQVRARRRSEALPESYGSSSDALQIASPLSSSLQDRGSPALFVQGAWVPGSQEYRIVTAHRIGPDGLTFRVSKRSRDPAVVRIEVFGKKLDGSRIQLAVGPITRAPFEPSRGVTVERRIYRIARQPDAEAFSLAPPFFLGNGSRTLVFVLDSDLAPGSYVIECRPLTAAPMYLRATVQSLATDDPIMVQARQEQLSEDSNHD